MTATPRARSPPATASCCSPSSTTTASPRPSFPLINTLQERRDMWLMKKYGLPRLYWGLMLRGRA